ncbi:MAG: tRNA 2-thiouridine(34) synthase MnmA [Bacteroidales bacterium]|nr:tRNA 2-thiouridine(34) synthase MnmA [Bacteroidales bacterium]MDY2917783.1 tRNA 2-thiouridine(34) synthase MnmA [Muribaculaceae bacterium]
MKIAVLISGGVDSAVAVHRLVEQGHDLHLFYIRIGRDDDEGGCSAEEDIEMCQCIAARYGLPLEVVSLHQEYWDNVMEYALKTVRQGLTPNPDIMCNRMIKFGFFEQRWGHEFDLTATGHYATTVERDGLKWLGTAVDPVKDQTDFLARITYDQLKHLIFPIGDMPKARVREIAIETHLPNALRKDSQGICFLGKINYNDFIRRHLGEKPGAIIEIETGRKLGEHRGYWFHTIGQRKGLGLSGGPWFVVRKNIHDNVIYVSRGYDTEKQYGRELRLTEMQFITADPWGDECTAVPIRFKNRHAPAFTEATLTRLDDGDYVIESAERVQGIAPGQFGVIYTPDAKICLGSGIITL